MRRVDQARLFADRFERERDRNHVFPRLGQRLQDDVEETIQDVLLYFRDFPVGRGTGLAVAPEQNLDDGKDQRWVQLQNGVPFVRLHAHRNDARGRRQTAQKLGIREMIDSE